MTPLSRLRIPPGNRGWRQSPLLSPPPTGPTRSCDRCNGPILALHTDLTKDDCCRACYKGDIPHGAHEGARECPVCYEPNQVWQFQERIECHSCGSIIHLDPLCPSCRGDGYAIEGWPCNSCHGEGRLIT